MLDNKYIVNQDCFCEHYLHEITKYYREGLVEKKLNKGDIVFLLDKWSNFYGTYLRVTKDLSNEYEYYDIPPHKLSKI